MSRYYLIQTKAKLGRLVQGGALDARKETRGSDQPWPPAPICFWLFISCFLFVSCTRCQLSLFLYFHEGMMQWGWCLDPPGGIRAFLRDPARFAMASLLFFVWLLLCAPVVGSQTSVPTIVPTTSPSLSLAPTPSPTSWTYGK